MDAALWQDFAVLGMAGLFASIVRAPVTGIILVFEITGNINTLLPLAAVSLISYAIADAVGSTPFYAALVDRITNGENAKAEEKKSEKVIKTYVIPTGSPADSVTAGLPPEKAVKSACRRRAKSTTSDHGPSTKRSSPPAKMT